jgi:hydroxypyruvate reductase
MVDASTPEDLFLVVISGGSSALMNCPAEGISVEEESRITELLLTAGANILEINTVRRHISAVNGGRLAQRVASRGAEMISLVLSDRVNDTVVGTPRVPVAYAGTQVGIDPTSFADAWKVIDRYRLAERSPASVITHLRKGPELEETPKAPLSRQHIFVIQGLEDACAAAVDVARRAGIPSLVLTTCLEGDSRQAGIFLASLAREIRCRERPLSPPCLLIAVGETTVRLDGPAGKGGPSQELALSFAQQIIGLEGIGIAAVETEGTDGPTQAAGALTDATTVLRAGTLGLDLLDILDRHDSFSALTALGDALITGNTGTNVCDLNLIYIR